MKEKFLPIGTVVLLNGGSKKIMINGYCAVTEDNKNKVFDYRGCPFPEGVIVSEGVALFDHEQIKEICHMGYKNKKVNDFLETIDRLANK